MNMFNGEDVDFWASDFNKKSDIFIKFNTDNCKADFMGGGFSIEGEFLDITYEEDEYEKEYIDELKNNPITHISFAKKPEKSLR